MNDKTREIILYIGALSEILGEFTMQLQKRGYSRSEAMRLTETFLKSQIIKEDK